MAFPLMGWQMRFGQRRVKRTMTFTGPPPGGGPPALAKVHLPETWLCILGDLLEGRTLALLTSCTGA